MTGLFESLARQALDHRPEITPLAPRSFAPQTQAASFEYAPATGDAPWNQVYSGQSRPSRGIGRAVAPERQAPEVRESATPDVAGWTSASEFLKDLATYGSTTLANPRVTPPTEAGPDAPEETAEMRQSRRMQPEQGMIAPERVFDEFMGRSSPADSTDRRVRSPRLHSEPQNPRSNAASKRDTATGAIITPNGFIDNNLQPKHDAVHETFRLPESEGSYRPSSSHHNPGTYASDRAFDLQHAAESSPFGDPAEPVASTFVCTQTPSCGLPASVSSLGDPPFSSAAIARGAQAEPRPGLHTPRYPDTTAGPSESAAATEDRSHPKAASSREGRVRARISQRSLQKPPDSQTSSRASMRRSGNRDWMGQSLPFDVRSTDVRVSHSARDRGPVIGAAPAIARHKSTAAPDMEPQQPASVEFDSVAASLTSAWALGPPSRPFRERSGPPKELALSTPAHVADVADRTLPHSSFGDPSTYWGAAKSEVQPSVSGRTVAKITSGLPDATRRNTTGGGAHDEKATGLRRSLHPDEPATPPAPGDSGVHRASTESIPEVSRTRSAAENTLDSTARPDPATPPEALPATHPAAGFSALARLHPVMEAASSIGAYRHPPVAQDAPGRPELNDSPRRPNPRLQQQQVALDSKRRVPAAVVQDTASVREAASEHPVDQRREADSARFPPAGNAEWILDVNPIRGNSLADRDVLRDTGKIPFATTHEAPGAIEAQTAQGLKSRPLSARTPAPVFPESARRSPFPSRIRAGRRSSEAADTSFPAPEPHGATTRGRRPPVAAHQAEASVLQHKAEPDASGLSVTIPSASLNVAPEPHRPRALSRQVGDIPVPMPADHAAAATAPVRRAEVESSISRQALASERESASRTVSRPSSGGSSRAGTSRLTPSAFSGTALADSLSVSTTTAIERSLTADPAREAISLNRKDSDEPAQSIDRQAPHLSRSLSTTPRADASVAPGPLARRSPSNPPSQPFRVTYPLADQPSQRRRGAVPAPVLPPPLRISIGRIAIETPPSKPKSPARPKPKLSLGEYLAGHVGRHAGGR